MARSISASLLLLAVAVCPAEGALFLSAPRRKRVPAWVVAAGVATLFVGTYFYARSTSHWNTNLSDSLYFELIPHANEFAHP